MKKISVFVIAAAVLLPGSSSSFEFHPLNIVSAAAACYVALPYINAYRLKNNVDAALNAASSGDVKKIRKLTYFNPKLLKTEKNQKTLHLNQIV